MTGRMPSDDGPEKLQRDTFGYFLDETNALNGLAPDSTREGAPSERMDVTFGSVQPAVPDLPSDGEM